jgi:hypothetical protein
MLRDGKSDPFDAVEEGADFLADETIGVHDEDNVGRRNGLNSGYFAP